MSCAASRAISRKLVIFTRLGAVWTILPPVWLSIRLEALLRQLNPKVFIAG